MRQPVFRIACGYQDQNGATTLRSWLMQRQVPHLQLGTLRLRLLKIGGWVRERLGVAQLTWSAATPASPSGTSSPRPQRR